MCVWGGKGLLSLQMRNEVRFSSQVKYSILSLSQMGFAWNLAYLNSLHAEKIYLKIMG
jgi:hypothetical protein